MLYPSVTWSIWQEAHSQSCVCTGDTQIHPLIGAPVCTLQTQPPDFQTGCRDYMWLTSSRQEFPCGRNQCYWNTAVPISTEVLLYIYTHKYSQIPHHPQTRVDSYQFFCFSFEHLCDQTSARDFTSTVPAAASHQVLESSLSCVVLSHGQGLNIAGIQWVMVVSKAQVASIFWDHCSGATVSICKAGKL